MFNRSTNPAPSFRDATTTEGPVELPRRNSQARATGVFQNCPSSQAQGKVQGAAVLEVPAESVGGDLKMKGPSMWLGLVDVEHGRWFQLMLAAAREMARRRAEQRMRFRSSAAS